MSDNEKKYIMTIDPAILKLLGPSLYTNIYYILAELIANAWDADAHNVYIIDNGKKITIEDDGVGMSYQTGGISKYLSVAKETRTSDSDVYTEQNRIKIGRKGIGKLSALAVSKRVLVMTTKQGEKSGFVMSREVPTNGELEPIPEDKIIFSRIKEHGTSIQMIEPEYKLNKGIDVIKRNLIKIFPIIDKDFQIHIEKDGKKATIKDHDKSIIPELAALITLGDEYKELSKLFSPEVSEKILELFEERPSKSLSVELIDKQNIKGQYNLEIKGWIGAYRSTRGRKTEVLEFQDNYLSLYSNGKMGEFNILPRIGQNRLNEVYVVGQLHVALFEQTNLPDMALSNRQGYKDDDLRYVMVTEFAQELLKDIIDLRSKWVSINNKEKHLEEIRKNKARETLFRENVKSFQHKVSSEVANAFIDNTQGDMSKIEDVEKIILESLEKNKSLLGLKTSIDKNKKRILISQTKKDKDLSDVIYNMLQYNGVSPKDIIFTNSDDEDARVPEGYSIYDYLRDFFVDSVSDEKMYVLYVTSQDMGKSWGSIVEVGANWITQMNHKIFNINDFRPEHPLNVEAEWHQSKRNASSNLEMDTVNVDKFCVKIESICDDLGYPHKSRAENKAKLKQLIIES